MFELLISSWAKSAELPSLALGLALALAQLADGDCSPSAKVVERDTPLRGRMRLVLAAHSFAMSS
jgi:hypothetical protein